MKPLRDLIQHWKPGARSGGATDTGAISSIWGDVVGADVAGRTRPAQLRDGTLTILTLSSAWSHQLSFLAPTILERVRARCPEAIVKRLRFLVATGRSRALLHPLKPRSGASRSRAPRARTSSDTPAPAPVRDSDDLDSLLQRLRRAQAALDERRRASGYIQCAVCESWTPPTASRAALCIVCAQEAQQRSDARVERALLLAPWLRRLGVDDAGTVSARQFDRVRERLLARWHAQLQAAQRRLRRGQLEAADRVTAWSYVMLVARAPQEEIGRAVVENILGAEWADSLAPKEAARRRPTK